ncbi:MAG: hypothetical protein GEU79_17850 [Acidimicrobiia bacterium]|nr:hypothetical protein [Acidimicrobiia bacterium]
MAGPNRADTLMPHLPTNTNIATQGVLHNLETRLDGRIDQVEGRMDELGAQIDSLPESMGRSSQRSTEAFELMRTVNVVDCHPLKY